MNIISSSHIKKPKPVSFNKIKSVSDFFSRMAKLTHNYIMEINQSKIFAGFIIIILNIASRYVNIRLSKTVESYLKHTFSRDILVFAISWMGTRDIYIATIIMIIFIVLVDFMLNEDSSFCCLPESFTEYHISLLDTSDNVLAQSQPISRPSVLENFKKPNK